MDKQQIIDYVLETPDNINPNILGQMLNEFADESNFFYYNNFDYEFGKLHDYVYQINFNKWDYELAKKSAEQYIDGKCSVVRNGKYIGRNLDYYYTPYVEFAIKCNGYNGRYSSIGMTSGIPPMTKQFIEEKKYDKEFQLLPFHTTDGINENGVFCEVNLLHQGDRTITTGTNPGKSRLCMSMIVRYVLDYAKTAEHAIELLNKKDIYAPTKKIKGEYHFLIADKDNTFEVEFINNKMVVIDTFLDNKPIVTNFYLDGYDGTKNTLNLHAQGVERFRILFDNYDTSNSEQGMINLMQSVYYNKTYERETDPFWYSEYNNFYPELKLDLNINSLPEEYEPVIQKAIEYYQKDIRDGKIWKTTHSVVYDLEEKNFILYPQNKTDQSFFLSFEDWIKVVYDGGTI